MFQRQSKRPLKIFLSTKKKLEALKKSTNLFVAQQRKKLLDLMKKEMSEAADRLDYEQAAVLRDQIIEIEKTYGK